MLGYIKLKNPLNYSEVEIMMNELAHKNEVPEFWVTKLQPLSETHLGSSAILFDNNNSKKGDIVYVYSLSTIAVFVLLIAAFNFMNLATARSSTRAKEVGIRKVMGAFKFSLILQHLGESMIICLIAFLIALGLVGIGSNYVPVDISDNVLTYVFNHSELLVSLILITLFIGLLAGIYPAFVLSSFKSVNILRGKFQTSKSGVLLRKVLVVTQFVASVTLIIATLFISKQIDFLKNKDLGFSKDQVLTILMNDPALRQKIKPFRDALLKYETISNSSMTSNMPGRTFGRTGVTPEGMPEDEENWIVSVLSIDENYFSVMGMELVEGRNYSPDRGTDQDLSIIVNEAFVNQLGWKNPIDKKLTMNNDQERRIIGVVKDFHFASMRHSIEPIMMFYNPNNNSNLAIKIDSDIAGTVEFIDKTWNEFYGEHPFEYSFFDQEFANMFESDDKFSELAMSFYLASHFNCLSGIIWTIHLYG